jgi:hypothetical protein
MLLESSEPLCLQDRIGVLGCKSEPLRTTENYDAEQRQEPVYTRVRRQGRPAGDASACSADVGEV